MGKHKEKREDRLRRKLIAEVESRRLTERVKHLEDMIRNRSRGTPLSVSAGAAVFAAPPRTEDGAMTPPLPCSYTGHDSTEPTTETPRMWVSEPPVAPVWSTTPLSAPVASATALLPVRAAESPAEPAQLAPPPAPPSVGASATMRHLGGTGGAPRVPPRMATAPPPPVFEVGCDATITAVPPSMSGASAPASNSTGLLALTGLLWGCTNPFIRRGTRGLRDVRARSVPAQVWAELAFLLGNWRYVVPWLVNQLGSLAYLLAVRRAPLSLAVPAANGLAFAATAATGAAIGDHPLDSGSILGIVLIVAGTALCCWDQVD